MEGTRCKDRDGCLVAMGKRVSASASTGAEKAAYKAKIQKEGRP